MSLTDGKSWWEENQGRARHLFAIYSLVALALVVILFHSEIKEFFSSHSWWEDALVALAGITVPVLGYFELRHSGEANQLHREANDFRAAANRLRTEANDLHRRIAELEDEETKHLAQIAANTQRPVSQAERKAEFLRPRLGTTAAVSEGKGVGAWGTSPEIVEVGDDNVVALFSPRSPSSGAARCVYVHCDDLEIVELPNSSLQLKVLKRYGDTVNLGEITKWEDRLQPAAAPVFDKGGAAYWATFNKPGSSETRSLHVFASRDGRNEFLLETGAGEKVIADNVEISKRFAIFEVTYRAEGFTCHNNGTGGSAHPLFIR
jgi:hypothetical protein